MPGDSLQYLFRRVMGLDEPRRYDSQRLCGAVSLRPTGQNRKSAFHTQSSNQNLEITQATAFDLLCNGVYRGKELDDAFTILKLQVSHAIDLFVTDPLPSEGDTHSAGVIRT